MLMKRKIVIKDEAKCNRRGIEASPRVAPPEKSFKCDELQDDSCSLSEAGHGWRKDNKYEGASG
jgi:hypothetical protein